MQNTQVTTILKEREEKRFEEFFTKFSKNQVTLTLGDFLLFSLDRNLVSNKLTIGLLLRFFDDAVDSKKGEKILSKPQFYFLLTQLSLHIYHNDKNHLDKLMNDILSEKNTVAKENQIEQPRQLIFDEINKRILSEPAIRAFCEFELETKNIFTIYVQENLMKGYIMLKWDELAMLNKKINITSVIKFARDAEIIPHIMSIEVFAENLMKIVPAGNNKEYEFYSKQWPLQIYEKALQDQVEGDPQMSFHEFQLLLARISFDVGLKEEGGGQIQGRRQYDVDKFIKRFQSELMLFRTNQNIQQPLPNLNRKLIRNLEKFSSQINKEDSQYEGSEDSDNEIHHQEQLNNIAQLQESLIFDQVQLSMPVDQIIRLLDKELPPLPQLPVTEPQMNKWDPDKRVTIGLPKPESPKNKNEKPKQNKPKNKQRRKQGEPEPRKIVFEHKEYPKQSEKYVQELSEKLQFEPKLVSDIERGSLTDIQVAPVLIPEILYPPNPPPNVQVLIEAAICAHNEANFIFAIQNYDEARKVWIQTQGRDLIDGLELYFEFSKGCVYESAGRDDMAMQCYLQARMFGNKLPMNNPDKALVYCGLGSVFYNTEEFEWSLRSFLKAREYREFSIGFETVDTATVYNNLGCCMFMLERNREANAYFKLSHAILETNLGQFHPRTLTASRNINKSNRAWSELQTEYPKLWVAYAQDKFAGGKKKKKKKGKK